MEILLLIAVIWGVLRFRKKTEDDERGNKRTKPTVLFQYKRKSFLMTKAENDFFQVISNIVGDQYYVFPQVHLSAIFDHKIKGQNWEAAFSYINQKSIDYLVCDKAYRRPLLGIELDDWSHDSESRKLRDANVEQIFREAGIPLLRFRDISDAGRAEISATIKANLPTAQSNQATTNSEA